MTADAAAILGIPVDNLSMETAVSGILDMVETFAKDQRPRYVATINVDFITNIHSWRMGQARHPELMHILRRADMVTADGMPIVWAARWLGAPLPMRVAGSDLVPRLCEAAAHTGKSVYFLGGKRFEMTAYRAARAIKKQLPGLKIAGVDAPWVHTSGEALSQAEEEDIRIVERINSARPDILFLAFGSPKQEIWFDRNRHRLKVPVAMGVGATFDFLAGTTARAPLWMQRSGFEWLFRLIQEPKRMWKRYLLDFLKFSVLIWPAISCRWLQSLKSRFTGNSTEHIERPCHASDTEDEVIFSLPKHLNATAAADSARHLQSASRITFDFSQVHTIDIDGLGTLARVWQQVEARGGAINIKGSSSAHKTYLACNMMTDFFGDTLNPSFSYRTDSLPGEIVLVKLCGVLDTRQVGGINYRQLLEHIGQRDCIFDMTELAYIGSSGLMLMLNISKYILSSGNCFVICSPRHHVKQMFHITDLQRLFVILPNVSGAASFIHDVRGEAAP